MLLLLLLPPVAECCCCCSLPCRMLLLLLLLLLPVVRCCCPVVMKIATAIWCHAVVAVIKVDVGAVKVAFAWCHDCILCYCVLYCQCMVHYLCMCYYQSCHCGFRICYAGSWCDIFRCIKAACAGLASSWLQLAILHVSLSVVAALRLL